MNRFDTWEKVKMILDVVHRDNDISLLVFSQKDGLIFADFDETNAPLPYERLLNKIRGEIKLMELLHEKTRKNYVGVCDEETCDDQKIVTSGQGTLKKRFSIYYESVVLNDEKVYIIKIKDTTEVLQYEQTILDLNFQLNQQLREVNESRTRLARQDRLVAIGHLASGIAHEINNPLGYVKSNFNVMSDYVEHMMRGYEDILQNLMVLEQVNFNIRNSEISEYIESLKRIVVENQINYISKDYEMLIDDTNEGIERVENIVDNLKRFSNLDHHTNLEHYELNQGVTFAIQMMQSRLKKGIKIIKDIQFVPVTLAYGAEMNQAVLNLLTNAIDAIENTCGVQNPDVGGHDTDGVIKITTRSDHKFIYLEIMDNGLGISDPIKDHIFDPFFTTKNLGTTVGLGLSIAYDVIVNKHGGELSFISELNKGSTFYVKIPVKHVESATLDDFIKYY